MLRQRLSAYRPVPSDQINVVYNGIECSVSGSPDQRLAIRKSWGVEDDTPVIGVVGRIEAQKNPLFLVKILKELQQLKLRFKAVWIGDGRMGGDLRTAVHKAGLEGQFHMDGWREDVPQRLQALDIFVLPSSFEGLPFALQEAMCAALPVCVTAVDGMGEVIVDGANGYLCRSDDCDHWVSRIATLLSNREHRLNLGKQARRFGELHFSTTRMAQDTVRIYEQALAALAESG